MTARSTGKWLTVGEANASDVYFYPNVAAHYKDFPKVAPKKKLKGVFVLSKPLVFERPDALHSSMTGCSFGLQCWIYETEDNSKVPADEKVSSSSSLIPTCCVGFMIDLMLLLMKDLSFDLDLYEVHDNKHGSKINGSWNGVIGDVHKRKADIGVSFLSMTKFRSEAVDFPAPFMFGNIAIATTKKESKLEFPNLEAFVPLNYGWAVVFGISFLGSILLAFAERYVCKRRKRYTLKESLTYVFGLMFQRDIGGDNPHHHSSRTMAVTIACGMMIIMTAYTAVLTARKIKPELEKTITGFDDPKVSPSRTTTSLGFSP